MFNLIKNKNLLLTFFVSFIFSATILIIGSNFIEQTKELKSMKNDLRKGLDQLVTSQISDRDDLKKQLSLLREELIRFKSKQEVQPQVLGESAPTPAVQVQTDIKGIVKLKNNWQKAEAYQDMRASSKIIGQLIKDKLYFIYEEDPNWYKIEYDLGSYGWVQKSLVDEL